ncbi:hypothetical protein AOLI_G00125640 [Acnodon oligacanthus]
MFIDTADVTYPWGRDHLGDVDGNEALRVEVKSRMRREVEGRGAEISVIWLDIKDFKIERLEVDSVRGPAHG